MTALPPGVVCYIVKSEMFGGRVVEVIGRWIDEDEPGDFYEVTASWAREEFPGRQVIAERRQLLPITPSAPETTKRTEAVT